MQLTSSQKKAVTYTKGPLLIIAGAGTGKTTVLVEKIKYILETKSARVDQVLGLTFTDKASHEMEKRLDEALPYGFMQLNIATFHSFCDRFLKEEGIQIGIPPNYKLYSQAQTVIFLKENLFLFDLNYYRPLGNPNKFIEGLVQHFSRLRDENITPQAYITWAKKNVQKNKKASDEEKIESEKYLELAKCYEVYQNLKIKSSILDFADLIYYTLQLLQKRKNILATLQKQYTHVLVDEFQDTNIAQYELIKLICPPKSKPNLTVIGDDNQSIYKFRGAAVSNILQFVDEYKGSKSIVLTENFRSNQQILDTAYKLIKHNDPDTLEAKLKINKNLISMGEKPKDKRVQLYISDNVEREADYVVSMIEKYKSKFQFSDFAILVRANKHADPFVNAFSYAGIPYQFLGPSVLFKQPEVKELIAYLYFINDISDSASLFRVLSIDKFGIESKDLSLLLSFTRKTSLSLYETLEIYLSFFYPNLYKSEFEPYKKYLMLLNKNSREKLYLLFTTIQEAISMVKKDSAGRILYHFVDKSGILADLMDNSTEKKEKIAQNISLFFDKLKTYEMEHEDASVSAVCAFLSMSIELGESPLTQAVDTNDRNAVNILSVHSAKGLEFPVVFLVNLIQDRFPTRDRKDSIPIPENLIKEVLPEGDFHIQEERRLFYVGVTRAKDRLFLCASRFYGDGKRERKPSIFLFESMGDEFIKSQLLIKKEEKAQLSFFDPLFISNAFGKKKEEMQVVTPATATTYSYSQLESYKLCPLRYKYQYILRIPIPTNAAASYGATVHKALELFYQLHKKGADPTLNTLIDLYHQSWIPIGYTSKAYEKRMKDEGKKLLTDFYTRHHNKNIQIVDLERWFRLKINTTVSIVGKIDRVDRLSNNEIEIIDYKTGKKPTLPELKKNLQLGIYAMAAQDENLYNIAPEHVSLTFYFLQNQEDKVVLKKTSDELVAIRKKVQDIVDEIQTSKFEAKVGPWCEFCPFKINCEAWQ